MEPTSELCSLYRGLWQASVLKVEHNWLLVYSCYMFQAINYGDFQLFYSPAFLNQLANLCMFYAYCQTCTSLVAHPVVLISLYGLLSDFPWVLCRSMGGKVLVLGAWLSVVWHPCVWVCVCVCVCVDNAHLASWGPPKRAACIAGKVPHLSWLSYTGYLNSFTPSKLSCYP